jgi:translation initiation factor IF-2
MGKKRVFELAKELGFQNRDFIDKLQKLGFEAKSHSSTVDEDDVRRALEREDEQRKANTVEQQVSRNVFRRRRKDDGEATTTTVVRRRPGAGGDVQVHARDPEPEAPEELTQEELPVVEAQAAVEPEAPVVMEAAPVELAPAAQAAATPAEPVVVAVEAPAQAGEAAAQVVEAPVVAEVGEAPATAADGETLVAATAEDSEEDDASKADARDKKREARTARPDRSKREEDYDEEDEKPDVEDFGISELDFAAREPAEVTIARVAPPPPSTSAQVKKEDELKPKIVRTIDPNVLKARLKASKRPEPPKEWGKPGYDMAASPVTELVVRTDATGKKKELVDVRKEQAKGKGGKLGARRREEMTAKDLLEHRRGQVYYPAPSRKKTRVKKGGKRPESMSSVSKQPISLGDTITVADLSQQMGRKAAEIIGFLMRNGVMANINQPVDFETAAMVCEEFGYEVESHRFEEEDLLMGEAGADYSEDPDAVLRAPVVTVMGHVDHGKTSLLDRIRKTNVAAGEAGGITQRVAGYQVPTSKGLITFLDTPGHAAFTAMRARGANVTDIVVLVVAADDGVMPQTREAIEHARAADVPMIVAVNKIDKAEANPDRVLQQLADMGILVEDWGGDVLSRRISAKTGDGVDDLLELIALQAEIMELKANPAVPAVAKVVEGHVHKGRGPVATVLVQEGTLRTGDIIVVGESIGRVRAMLGDGGRKVKEAGPSVPVEILGLDSVPNPGDDLRVAKDLDAAKELASHRRDKRRSAEVGTQGGRVSLQDLFARLHNEEQKELKIIIKADVQGSVEALRQALTDLSTEKVKVSVISGGVGAVTESDVEFAKASEAIVVGFGVRPDTNALKSARAMEVDIRSYSIIYEAVDEVRLAMQGLLSPVEKEKYLGRAEVRATFKVPKVGTVAGCAVVDGVVARSANIRLLRDAKPIYDGRLASLKRFKDDVREVKEGFECGMNLDRFDDIREGDIIEAYEIVLTEATLDGPLRGGAEARP